MSILNKENILYCRLCWSAAGDQGRTSIMLEVDNIDFHPNISASWYIGLFWMQVHKPIHYPPSPNITRAFWLIAVVPWMSAHQRSQNTHTHACTHSWGTLLILKVKSCREAPHWRPDGADTAQLIVHTCWYVPRRGLTAAQKADITPNHQCISMRGSRRSRLCWGGRREDCNKDKHICRLQKSQLYGVCNPKTGQWLSPSLHALTQFWFMIWMNIDFPQTTPPTSSLPFHFSF